MEHSVSVATGLSCSMPFIVSSNVDKVDPATRKLIRKHVMRGKKRKKTERLGVKGLASADSVQNHTSQISLQEICNMYTKLQPDCFGPHAYSVDFPYEIEPSILWSMQQVSTVAMQVMFPLLAEIGVQPEGKGWHYPVQRDAASFHINTFAVQCFIDRFLRHQPEDMVNPTAALHHQKGLKLIRERLDGNDEEVKVSDATIGVVLKLASAAQFGGHVEIAQQHMHGLWKMINLRGGLQVFQDNPKLLVEIWRCDLGIALLASSEPVFYHHPAEPLPDYPEEVISSCRPGICSQRNMQAVQELDASLGEIWLVMRQFCLLVNLWSQTRVLVRPSTIYGTMTAVMYRLLGMRFATGSLDESSRLGLLAFTHHIFLQWQGMRLPAHPFSESYRSYLRIHALGNTISAKTSLWLLMVGAVSLFSVSNELWLADYLRKQAERCGVKTWKDMSEVLKMCMWISVLDDKFGKQVFHHFQGRGG